MAEQKLDDLLVVLRQLLGKVLGCVDVDTISIQDYDTVIRARLLYRWAVVAQDPGADVCSWCWDGAPSGVECRPDEADGMPGSLCVAGRLLGEVVGESIRSPIDGAEPAPIGPASLAH